MRVPTTAGTLHRMPALHDVSPDFNLRVFGLLTGEMVLADARPTIPSGIVLIAPCLGQNTQTVEVHAKSSSLGIAFTGAKIAGLHSGGTFFSYLYGR